MLVDIQKAFDTVNHQILLKKLELYGIRGLSHKLLKSFLSDRPYKIATLNSQSEQKVMNIGISQGSILGPLLFIIFINDLPQICQDPNTNITLFADDTVITCSNKNIDNLTLVTNSLLTKLSEWMIANRLSINAEKTEALLTTLNKNADNDIRVSLDNNMITCKESVKYLGIHIDNNLKFKTNCNNVLNKISKNTGILFRIKHFIPT